MTFIDTRKLAVVERKPGWHGRYFDSASMTFGHYDFDAGADEVLSYGNVQPEQVRDLVHGAIFTRGPKDWRSQFTQKSSTLLVVWRNEKAISLLMKNNRKL